jgi:hypothetical protein
MEVPDRVLTFAKVLAALAVSIAPITDSRDVTALGPPFAIIAISVAIAAAFVDVFLGLLVVGAILAYAMRVSEVDSPTIDMITSTVAPSFANEH